MSNICYIDKLSWICLQLNFHLPQNFHNIEFWYNTEVLPTGGRKGTKSFLGSAITVPWLLTGRAGAKPLLGSAIPVPWFPTGDAGAKPLLKSANNCSVSGFNASNLYKLYVSRP